MEHSRAHSCRTAAHDRARLRTAVLRLGGMLGWQPERVIMFTEALTRRRWRRCGRPELEAVLREYRSVIDAVETKAARRAARAQGGDHVARA